MQHLLIDGKLDFFSPSSRDWPHVVLLAWRTVAGPHIGDGGRRWIGSGVPGALLVLLGAQTHAGI